MSGDRSYLSYLRRSSIRCLSQYCPSQRFGQPGWEHGLFGLCGMRLLLSTTKATAGFLPTMALYAILHDTIIPHHRRKVVHDITHLRRTEVGEMRSLFFKAKATAGLLPTMALHAILHDTIIPHRRRKVVHDITHLLPHRSKMRCGHSSSRQKPPRDCSRDGLYAFFHATIIPHRRRKVVHDITHHLPYSSKARCWIARFFLLYAEERSMLK